MDWSSLYAPIYLLGVLFTAAALAKPIRRIMGDDQPGVHADTESANDVRMLVIFTVIGVSALWPITIAAFIASRVFPSANDDRDDGLHGIALADSAE